jgi:hypothetical protein
MVLTPTCFGTRVPSSESPPEQKTQIQHANRIIYIYLPRGNQYLDYRVGLMFLCSGGIPGDGISVYNYISVDIMIMEKLYRIS